MIGFAKSRLHECKVDLSECLANFPVGPKDDVRRKSPRPEVVKHGFRDDGALGDRIHLKARQRLDPERPQAAVRMRHDLYVFWDLDSAFHQREQPAMRKVDAAAGWT